MNHKTIADYATTGAGAGMGGLLLSQVDWAAVAGGETTRLVVALLLMAGGALLYGRKHRDEGE